MILTRDGTMKGQSLNDFSFSVIYQIIFRTSNLLYGKILQSYGLHIYPHLKCRFRADSEYQSSFNLNSNL